MALQESRTAFDGFPDQVVWDDKSGVYPALGQTYSAGLQGRYDLLLLDSGPAGVQHPATRSYPPPGGPAPAPPPGVWSAKPPQYSGCGGPAWPGRRRTSAPPATTGTGGGRPGSCPTGGTWSSPSCGGCRPGTPGRWWPPGGATTGGTPGAPMRGPGDAHPSSCTCAHPAPAPVLTLHARVERGPHWRWADQDGGPGTVGVIRWVIGEKELRSASTQGGGGLA